MQTREETKPLECRGELIVNSKMAKSEYEIVPALRHYFAS